MIEEESGLVSLTGQLVSPETDIEEETEVNHFLI